MQDDSKNLIDLLMDRLNGQGKPDDRNARLIQALDKLSASLGKTAPDAPSPGVDAGKGSIGNVLSSFDGVFGQITGKFSEMIGKFQANINAVLGYVQQAASYVAVLNPAIVEQMNLAFRDFSATIGVALVPIVSAATQYSRTLGSILLPIMSELEPVVSRLASAFLQLVENASGSTARMFAALRDAADVVADLALAMAPAIEGLQAIGKVALQVSLGVLQGVLTAFRLLEVPIRNVGAFFEALSPAFEAFAAHLSGVQAVIGAVLTGVQTAFSSILGTVNGSGLRSALETLSRYALLAGAYLARLLGVQAAYVEGVRKAFEPGDRQNNTGLASIQNTSYQQFSEFGRNVALSASKATGAGPELTKDERDKAWQQSVLRDLEKLAKGQPDLMKEVVDYAMPKIKKIVADEVTQLAKDLKTDLVAQSQGLASKALRTAAGPILGRLIP